jgi:hypothetical protein
MDQEENVTSSGSETVSMQDSMFAKKPATAPGTTLGQEPPQGETTAPVEDTTLKTPVEASDTPVETVQPQPVEAEGDTKHSSKVISELGEDRKAVLGKFFERAKKDGATAEELKELIASNPRIEKLAKTKFGTDYDALMEAKATEPQAEVDVEEIKRKAKLEAQLEAMQEEDARLRARQFDIFAQSQGLNSDEAEQVREHAELLEEKFGYEGALEKSLLLVNKDKATAGSGYQSPAGGQLSKEPDPTKVEVTDDLKAFVNKGYGTGRKPEAVAEGLQRVAKGLNPDGSYTLSLGD